MTGRFSSRLISFLALSNRLLQVFKTVTFHMGNFCLPPLPSYQEGLTHPHIHVFFQFVSRVISRQEERKRHLSSFCKAEKGMSSIHPRQLNHLIVDKKHKVVYCYIPKVACTSWKKIMAQLVNLNYKGTSVHKLRFDLLSYHSKSDVLHILNNYYKFMFVRDPYSRLLSAFKDKFSKKSSDIYVKYERIIKRTVRLKLVGDANTRTSQKDINFEAFILYLIDISQKGGRLNEHWRQYYKLCFPCQINYDFIGHYETLEEDARFALQNAGVDELVAFPPVSYTSTKDDLRHFYSEVPPEYISKLQSMYGADFEMFGYKNKSVN